MSKRTDVSSAVIIGREYFHIAIDIKAFFGRASKLFKWIGGSGTPLPNSHSILIGNEFNFYIGRESKFSSQCDWKGHSPFVSYLHIGISFSYFPNKYVRNFDCYQDSLKLISSLPFTTVPDGMRMERAADPQSAGRGGENSFPVKAFASGSGRVKPVVGPVPKGWGVNEQKGI